MATSQVSKYANIKCNFNQGGPEPICCLGGPETTAAFLESSTSLVIVILVVMQQEPIIPETYFAQIRKSWYTVVFAVNHYILAMQDCLYKMC